MEAGNTIDYAQLKLRLAALFPCGRYPLNTAPLTRISAASAPHSKITAEDILFNSRKLGRPRRSPEEVIFSFAPPLVPADVPPG